MLLRPVKSYLNNIFELMRNSKMRTDSKMFPYEMIIFTICMIIFISYSILGWIKLKYGFTFLDEGFHMTESWRVAVGDPLLKDRCINSLRLFTWFNSGIFKFYPDITLLGFRSIQYFLSLGAIILFSLILYKTNKQYWYQPLIFSLFAFTGLDPLGATSNLSYYTYPHFFLTIHISFFLLALMSQKLLLRKTYFIISGFLIWAISLSLLHLGIIIIYPILLFIILKKIDKLNIVQFSLNDLFYVLAPFILCWFAFIIYYNDDFFIAIFKALNLYSTLPNYSTNSIISINWEALKHICIVFLMLLGCLMSIKFTNHILSFLLIISFAALQFMIIHTSFWGMITPYGNGWYSRPAWFSSLIISIYLLFLLHIIINILRKKNFDQIEIFSMIILFPCFLLFVIMSTFSGFGFLTAAHCSIPTIGAMSLLVIQLSNLKDKSIVRSFLILGIILLPFYYHTSWSDWRFTYFDVPPDKAVVTINEGFGKGIKTNYVYKELYGIITLYSDIFTYKDDYIISTVLTPMAYMIAKRKPALDDSFICPSSKSIIEYYRYSVNEMIILKRNPVVAFIFENSPAFYPTNNLRDDNYPYFGPWFTFPNNDPVTKYVISNMELSAVYPIIGNQKVRVFIDFKKLSKAKIDQAIDRIGKISNNDNGNMLYQSLLYRLYIEKGDVDLLLKKYVPQSTQQVDIIKQLSSLAIIYRRNLDYKNSIYCLNKIILMQPENKDALYNLACLYTIQGDKEKSIFYLRSAINNGFNKRELLRTDHDLDKIRDTSEFKEMIR